MVGDDTSAVPYPGSRRRLKRSTGQPATALALALAVVSVPGAGMAAEPAVPSWLYPANSASDAKPVPDPTAKVRLAGSSVIYTEAELGDLFSAPDWGLQPHTLMPSVVARGRRPDVFACGYCHTPSGQGRPENASIAGLPAAYLALQLEDFRSGKRHGVWPGPYSPVERMIQSARHLTEDEIRSVAEYFSKQHLARRVEVVEVDAVPRSRIVGLVYVAIPHGGTEPLGQRIMEFAPDAARHEHRDDAMKYTAYVPLNSVDRGRLLVTTGRENGSAEPCTSCHGGDLRGGPFIPGIAGRSPTYLLRALLGFQTGARQGAASAPMQTVCVGLSLGEMIDAVAFAASLPP